MHLYLHVPFCARRCSYCDFAIAVRRDVPSRRFVDQLLREWRGWAGSDRFPSAAPLATIYLGGGTPRGSSRPSFPASSRPSGPNGRSCPARR